ncbi:uncharacterized protein LOC106178718 [Lingula anatina]|uniref:Uncharacterized protein LOC106178718 n=1 Tax=Lingula anatina TaxID=7574 RepID=A0A1S3K4X9_LINAN|nr:uncharacterized protein LOC106178718 [Lingula anatina]|eukprot:XP_013417469.1 uncharacterized protein LOC106178718 [Lingula anatina]
MNVYLALCVLLTAVMLFHSQKKGHAQKFTQKAPDVVNVTPEGITTESVYLEEGMTGKNTTNAPNPQSGMHVETTQESPNAESAKEKGTMQKPQNQEGALDEEESFPNEIEQTVEPHRWLCLKKTYRSFSIKIYCSCDSLCVLYGDCCYGMPENTKVCAASTKIKKQKSSSHSKTILASNLTVAEINSTILSHNKTSSWEWHEKPGDPVAISLALKSSCRNRPQLQKQLPKKQLPHVDRNGPRFLMVDQCPSSWLDEKTRLKCTDTPNASLSEDVLLQQPVTDPDSMITFRNKYCAACNGIENGLEPWGLVVSCRRTLIHDFVNCSSSACVLRKLEKEKCNGIFEANLEWNLRMCFREIENDAFGPCKFRLINGSVYRLPLPLPLHSALRDACLAYNNPVIVDGSEGIEKNYHCMVCYYGVQFCDDIYKPPDDFRAIEDLSFRALLYVGDLNRNQDDDVMTMVRKNTWKEQLRSSEFNV